MKRLILTLGIFLLFPSTALAHGNDPGAVEDGRIVIFDEGTKYRAAWWNAAIEWNKGPGPDFYYTDSKDRATLILRDVRDCSTRSGAKYSEGENPDFVTFNLCYMDRFGPESRQKIAEHELGHGYGLDHTPLTRYHFENSVMFPYFFGGKSPHVGEHDRKDLARRYP